MLNIKKAFDDVLISKTKRGNSYKIIIDNLPETFGVTLKNFIRRSLLSFSNSYKVFAVQIEDIKHELQNKEGILESTIDLLERIQEINFSHKENILEDENIYVFSLKKSLTEKVNSIDFVSESDDLDITTNCYLFKKTTNTNIDMKLFVRKSVGFVPKINNLKYITDHENCIVMDTDFSSLEYLNIKNEEFFTSFDVKKEKITIDLSSKDTEILSKFSETMFQFGELLKKMSTLNVKKEVKKELKILVSNLKLSKRVRKCLEMLEIKNLKELEEYTLSSLTEMKGIGKITLSEIKILMEKHDINFKN